MKAHIRNHWRQCFRHLPRRKTRQQNACAKSWQMRRSNLECYLSLQNNNVDRSLSQGTVFIKIQLFNKIYCNVLSNNGYLEKNGLTINLCQTLPRLLQVLLICTLCILWLFIFRWDADALGNKLGYKHSQLCPYPFLSLYVSTSHRQNSHYMNLLHLQVLNNL